MGGILATFFVFYSEFQNKKNHLNLKLHREIDQVLLKDKLVKNPFPTLTFSIFYQNIENGANFSENPLHISEDVLDHLRANPTKAILKHFGPYSYISKKTFVREVIIVMSKGELRWMIMQNLRITYIVFFLMLILCTLNTKNIRKLKASNENLLKESKKMNFAQTTAKLGTWEFIVSTQSFIWEEETFKIFDMDPKRDEEPSLNDFFSMATKESRAKVKEAYESVLINGVSRQTEISIITPKGNKKFLLSRAEALVEGNKVERIFGTSIDITEKRKLEEEIAIERQKKLEDNRMAAIGELSSNIAHEITTPMTVISGQATLMKMKLQNDEFDKDIFLQRCEKIEETIRRMGHIISSLRILSRRSPYDEFEPTLVKDVFQSVFYFVSPRLREFHIDFHITPYSEDLAILAKPVEISQVLLNLINNSIDAISELEEKWLRIEIAGGENFVHITITDSGQINAEIKERILKDSFTTKPIGKGTGIGLTVSKRIIEAHKGSLAFMKDAPTTTFTISLPRAELSDV